MVVNTRKMDFEIIRYVTCHVPDMSIGGYNRGAWKDEIIDNLKSKNLMPTRMTCFNQHLQAMVSAGILDYKDLYHGRFEFYFVPEKKDIKKV
jgi:hypothetical protein